MDESAGTTLWPEVNISHPSSGGLSVGEADANTLAAAGQQQNLAVHVAGCKTCGMRHVKRVIIHSLSMLGAGQAAHSPHLWPLLCLPVSSPSASLASVQTPCHQLHDTILCQVQ